VGLVESISGGISVGKVKLCPENIPHWQEYISYVPQNIFLFDGSIEQNIAFEFGSEIIDRERVAKAIQLSALTDFVSSLPNKTNTLIGERGVKLSGGQRQRIGIARALYKKSKIIIMDEATNAIDLFNESKIIQSLETLQDRPTIISITHRISVLKNCKVIYVMKEGRLVSSGSFEYLLKNCQDFGNLSNIS
jgi:ABC-type bacteriocin/lantibiotic exporter with double-glycine peptidase domain